MRQRIKAIETIKKITHAMRLISMSTHTRLKAKEHALKYYKTALSNLFIKLRSAAPSWRNELLFPSGLHEERELIILIGSQKGLCGNFNNSLFTLFQKTTRPDQLANAQIIAIGKKAVDYVHHEKIGSMVTTFTDFNYNTLNTVAATIAHMLVQQKKPFTNVTIYGNRLKTFFVQKPQHHTLIPFGLEDHMSSSNESTEDYDWEQTPQEMLDLLIYQYLEAELYEAFFQSLLSEQAARFLSMDSSTRNAESLLESTKLQYNKIRQTKITKEVTELSGSF
jgi:F-type H+-transporting ATPase subunit gamma